MMEKLLAQRNNGSLWLGSNSRLTRCLLYGGYDTTAVVAYSHSSNVNYSESISPGYLHGQENSVPWKEGRSIVMPVRRHGMQTSKPCYSAILKNKNNVWSSVNRQPYLHSLRRHNQMLLKCLSDERGSYFE